MSTEKYIYQNHRQSYSLTIKMDSRDSLTRSNVSHRRKISLDFSRHLCVTTRLARSSVNQKPLRRFSDSEATPFFKQTGYQSCDHSEKRNAGFSRQLSLESKKPRRQVYNLDQAFHRKFGHNNVNVTPRGEALELSYYRANRDLAPTTQAMDDGARSFCDSISSVACSNLTKPDVGKQKMWTNYKRKFPDRIEKFQAIEKWLQSLPEPVLKPASDKPPKL